MDGAPVHAGASKVPPLAAQVGNDLLIHGASARSSDEAPVMGVERRGIVNMDSYVNRKSRKP